MAMGKPLVDLSGNQIGYWTVLRRAENKGGHAQWFCRCKCGNEKVIVGIVLRDRRSQSCGCLHRESCIARSTKHGNSERGKVTRTYRVWQGMIKRCTNTNDKSYPYYGGRGIKVCERWNEFGNFIADMGEVPTRLTIGRIDNFKDYEPGNCQWETLVQQANNKRNNRYLELGGERLSVKEWAAKLNLPYHRIMTRLNRGWSIERALSL